MTILSEPDGGVNVPQMWIREGRAAWLTGFAVESHSELRGIQ